MTLKEQSILSFYKELSAIDAEAHVFLVQQVQTGKIYVKKVLDRYDPELYRQLMAVRIEGIPRIYECMEDEGKLYLIEDYIHGVSLEELGREKGGCFSEAEVVDYGIELCEILERLHEMKPPVIHRDVKPSNIMISEDGFVKLIDFNAARIYSQGAVRDTVFMGTQTFAAPEQYGFGQSDQRTDIYGLGVTLNYLLTGAAPMQETAQGPIGLILQKCTQISPKDRYQSAAELKADLMVWKKMGDKTGGAADSPAPGGSVRMRDPGEYRDTRTPGDSRTMRDPGGYRDTPIQGDSVRMRDPEGYRDTRISGGSRRMRDSEGYRDMRTPGGSERMQYRQGYGTMPDSDSYSRPQASGREWLPPGFRTGRLWKKLLAVVGYFLMIELGLTVVDEESPEGFPTFAMRVTVLALEFVTLFWFSNYMHIQERFPGMRGRRWTRSLLSVVYWFLLVFAIFLLYCLCVA